MGETIDTICNQCGRSVERGSEWFVNRVPSDFGGLEAAKEAGTPYPEGEWQCSECANDINLFKVHMSCGRLYLLDRLDDELGRIPTPEETDACVDYVAGDTEKLTGYLATMLLKRIDEWIEMNKTVKGQ